MKIQMCIGATGASLVIDCKCGAFDHGPVPIWFTFKSRKLIELFRKSISTIFYVEGMYKAVKVGGRIKKNNFCVDGRAFFNIFSRVNLSVYHKQTL